MSYVGTCTYCYRRYVNRRRRGTYCMRCRIRTWPRRTHRRFTAAFYDWREGI